MSTPLQELIPLAEYRVRRPAFQSDEALRWELRQHGPEYIQAGALVLIGRRHWVHPEKFDGVAYKIGMRKAAERAKAQAER